MIGNGFKLLSQQNEQTSQNNDVFVDVLVCVQIAWMLLQIIETTQNTQNQLFEQQCSRLIIYVHIIDDCACRGQSDLVADVHRVQKV